MKLKLDLHTHCLEATHFARPTSEVVRQIVTRVKEQGLDGIAITDHQDKNFAYAVKEVVARDFDNEIIVIPGQELDRVYHHMVELYLPNNLTFRFIAHPGYPSRLWDDNLEGIHGVEISNGNYGIDEAKVREVAQRHGLLILSNSDAHTLSDIGRYYNEIELEELCARARGEI